MLKKSFCFIALCVLILSVGCASTRQKGSSVSTSGEKMIWSSQDSRPKWLDVEPDFEGSYMYFVGISSDMANEQLSRDDAMSNAAKTVVKYIGTLVKDKFEKASTSFGLAGDVVNPTEVRNAFEKQISAGAARNLKAKEWYQERWEKPTGIAWKAYLLAKIPTNALDNSFKKVMDNQIRAAQQRQKETNDNIAKQQLEKAIDMMKKMKEAGIAD